MSYLDFVSENYLEMSLTPDMAIDTGRPIEYEKDLVKKDGAIRNVATTLYSVNDARGEPNALAVVIRDITERRSLERQLTHQALHDPLTGLANRVLLSDRISMALNRSKRSRGKLALLYIDLDNFKTVNDTLGHAGGDCLLATVAERISSCLRATDTAARMGGDEFAVLIENIGEANDETLVAKRILDELRTAIRIHDKEAFVGASIGIALSQTDTLDPDILIRSADIAMYAAKKSGKNKYAVYKDDMHAETLHKATIESEIRGAVERNEFEVYYQPIMDLSDGSLVALEALLRWNHPRGSISARTSLFPSPRTQT